MQPNQPDQENTSPVLPAQPPRIIQPVSSEADILREARENMLKATPEPVQLPSSASTPNDPLTSYETSLATEPLRKANVPIPGAPHSDPTSTHVLQPVKKRRTVPLVVCSLLVVGIGVAAMIYWGWQRVSTADLVEENVQNTSYLRPKQWKSIGLGASSFGDLQSKEGKSNAIVSLTVLPMAVSTSSGSIEILRAQIMSTVTAEAMSAAMQRGSVPCKTDISLQKEEDTSSTTTTTGLYKVTASCEREDGRIVLKMRGVIGADGYVRNIGLGAPQSLWNKNQEAYQKIIDSLQQKAAS